MSETIGFAAIEPAMRDAGFRERHGSFSSVLGVAGQRVMRDAVCLMNGCLEYGQLQWTGEAEEEASKAGKLSSSRAGWREWRWS